MQNGGLDEKQKKQIGAAVVAVIALLVGFLFSDRLVETFHSLVSHKVSRQLEGEILGFMPKPVHPDLVDPVVDSVRTKNTKKVVIKRIPRIGKGVMMPHPYWGRCEKCHLIRGGPAKGGQQKSIVGKTLEQVSTVRKVGPPILPDSHRPHPAAGRCIKCHDIVIQVPV